MSLLPQAPGGTALVTVGAPSGQEGSSSGQRGTAAATAADGLRSSLAALLQHCSLKGSSTTALLQPCLLCEGSTALASETWPCHPVFPSKCREKSLGANRGTESP